MKMTLRVLLALVIGSACAFAQGVRYDDRVVVVSTNVPSGANTPLLAVPSASVRICVDPACATLATVYLDAALTHVISNPVTATAAGSYGFWASAGTYYKKYPNDPQIYPFTLGGSGSGGAGTVTSLSDLDPLFTVANRTTTPTFSVKTVNGHTVYGNNTGSVANPSFFSLTYTDISGTPPLFGTSAVGAVPASGGGSTNFLRADGSWAAPPGGGGSTAGGSGVVQKSNGSGGHVASSITDNGTTVATTEPISAPGFTGTDTTKNGYANPQRAASGDVLPSNPAAHSVDYTVYGDQPVVLFPDGTTQVVVGSNTYSSLTDGAPITWATAGVRLPNATVTLVHTTGTRALNMTGLVSGASGVLVIKQDGTGGAAMTLGTGCTWKVSGGGTGAITLTTTANAIDILSWSYDGTNCYANLQTNFN